MNELNRRKQDVCGTRARYMNAGCRCDLCRAAWAAHQIEANKSRRERLADTTAVEHGKATTYANWSCRCEPCKAAHSVVMRQQAQSRKDRLAADPSIVEHGRAATYQGWGCRCEPCKAAAIEYEAGRYERKKARRETS